MSTNFDFLKNEEEFKDFADIAVSAEKILHFDHATCVINCRRAMEIAIKWMYSVDKDLIMPWQDKLSTLMSTMEFKQIMDPDVLRRMDLVRIFGNQAAHGTKSISEDQAKLCLENLWYFMDWIAYCYSTDYAQGEFHKEYLNQTYEEQVIDQKYADIDIEKLIEENKAFKEEKSARREEQKSSYVANPLELSEFKTRRTYIDTMLSSVGWRKGKDWIDEYELEGMPNQSEVGFADYVLFSDDGTPLAVIEAKKTCKDVEVGRQQGKLYADLLEKKFGRRPIVFLTNGFEYRINDGVYPERKVSEIYSKRDLEKLFNLRQGKGSLDRVQVNSDIAGRYYQIEAIKKVCESLDKQNRRKALLVMATGSGKTRTVIGLVDVLLKNGWIKNVLFLADRNALVIQAKRAFTNLLPNLTNVNLTEDKTKANAHAVFSTYQTMIHSIDDTADEEGKLFSNGHFDLVICDEAHRSLYNKYQDIFTYFDAPLIGLTATPKDDIDKNTYDIFELESGVPTYGYELGQAVEDKFLVPYISVEAPLKFPITGIGYDELNDREKEEYEESFIDEDGKIPERIAGNAINTWVFNQNTVDRSLDLLWQKGLRIDSGENLGKTIIFAKNHKHAEFILKRFNVLYPNFSGYAEVIDNTINYSQSLIDQFSDPKKLPQIAISVDMLDTGIDVPEILNLVMFKQVYSKAKFWQMIGRGTRLCKGLIDGKDKENFYIFDLCGNFEFFRMNDVCEVANVISLQCATFVIKARICSKLQEAEYQIDDLIELRKRLVNEMLVKVQELNRETFSVRQHLKYVEMYSDIRNYQTITFEDTFIIINELAPLILPDHDDPAALGFDYLCYQMEYCYLASTNGKRFVSLIKRKTKALSKMSNIPQIKNNSHLIEKINNEHYVDTADIKTLEDIRLKLRELIKYIQNTRVARETNFEDDFIQVIERPAELPDELPNYRKTAEYYLKNHFDVPAIKKIRSNLPLDSNDIKELEHILFDEIGSKKEYEKDYATVPLGEFVRRIVGLDANAAKEAFADFINENNLNSDQIYFVNQVVEYFIQNGMMTDLRVLQDTPFTDNGSVSDIFTNMNEWNGIRKIINTINANVQSM